METHSDWQAAVFRVAKGSSPQRADGAAADTGEWASAGFVGTAFVCARDGDISYLLTCAHVVDAAGSGNLRINNQSAEVVFKHQPPVDIALLTVRGLPADTPILPLPEGASHACRESLDAITYGWTGYDGGGSFARGKLHLQVTGGRDLESDWSVRQGIPVRAWDLKVKQQTPADVLHGGYSGAPMLDPVSRRVVALISHQQSGDIVSGHAMDLALLDLLPDPELRRVRELSAAAPPVDDYDYRFQPVSDGLAYMLDHDEQLPTLKLEADPPARYRDRDYYLLPACRSDRPSLLAEHLMLDRDHRLLRSDREAAECISGPGSPADYSEHAFWNVLTRKLLPDYGPNNGDAQDGVWQVLNRRSLTVLYTSVELTVSNTDIRTYINGAMAALDKLPPLDDDKRLVVLFACLRPEWRWLPRPLRERLVE